MKELLRLRKDDRTGAVPMDVLRRLRLPMPEDVLEQFLGDHGIKHEFQQQYGELDLHGLRWDLVQTAAKEIIACSAYPGFQEWVQSCRKRTLDVPKTGWAGVHLAADAKKHWQTHRTWRRAPVFIRGELVGSDRPLHLVEGHTRTGALKGLVESEWLSGDSMHEIWLASLADVPSQDASWQQVLREERMPFADWLIYRTADNGPLGKVSDKVLSARCDEEIDGADLAAVLAFIAKDPNLARHAGLVQEAHRRWQEETMK
jgi:hypothetical protein